MRVKRLLREEHMQMRSVCVCVCVCVWQFNPTVGGPILSRHCRRAHTLRVHPRASVSQCNARGLTIRETEREREREREGERGGEREEVIVLLFSRNTRQIL